PPGAGANDPARGAPLPRRTGPQTLPPVLERIILPAMPKDPDSGYQTADDLRTDLLRFVRGQPPIGGPVAALLADGAPTAAVAPPQAGPVPAEQDYDSPERRPERLGAFVAPVLPVGLVAARVLALPPGRGGGGRRASTRPGP